MPISYTYMNRDSPDKFRLRMHGRIQRGMKGPLSAALEKRSEQTLDIGVAPFTQLRTWVIK